MMADFASWLEQTALCQWIQASGWVIPAVQSVHILALATIMTAMAMFDFRLMGLTGRGQSLQLGAGRFLPTIWYALPVSLTTGLILIAGEPPRELESSYFWAKMLMLGVVIAITLAVRPLLADCPLGELDRRSAFVLRIAGSASLALWLAIIFCGRWIAYG